MSDCWRQQRLDDAVWADREARGLCGNCGEANGEGHRCPPLTEQVKL